eukprot:753874-Hanusia_phi.AAC.7
MSHWEESQCKTHVHVRRIGGCKLERMVGPDARQLTVMIDRGASILKGMRKIPLEGSTARSVIRDIPHAHRCACEGGFSHLSVRPKCPGPGPLPGSQSSSGIIHLFATDVENGAMSPITTETQRRGTNDYDSSDEERLRSLGHRTQRRKKCVLREIIGLDRRSC